MSIADLIALLGEKLRFDSTYDEAGEEWVLNVHLENHRNQAVRVFAQEDGGVQFARFVTNIGSASEFNERKLRTALEMNASLPHGTLAIFEGSLVMLTSLRLESDLSQAAEVVGYIVRTADTYEKLLFGLDRA
ncbi:MAG: hypothetical protein EB084_05735 [Proteobacteria bacterium]|nr:hypothetical protein [Pseudomonadota bacterium]